MDISEQQHLASPSNQLSVNFMQKFGFLPYPLNGLQNNSNGSKFLMKSPYENSQLADDVSGFGYDNESLNSINNAAAAYALYGRMLQQQVSWDFHTLADLF